MKIEDWEFGELPKIAPERALKAWAISNMNVLLRDTFSELVVLAKLNGKDGDSGQARIEILGPHRGKNVYYLSFSLRKLILESAIEEPWQHHRLKVLEGWQRQINRLSKDVQREIDRMMKAKPRSWVGYPSRQLP